MASPTSRTASWTRCSTSSPRPPSAATRGRRGGPTPMNNSLKIVDRGSSRRGRRRRRPQPGVSARRCLASGHRPRRRLPRPQPPAPSSSPIPAAAVRQGTVDRTRHATGISMRRWAATCRSTCPRAGSVDEQRHSRQEPRLQGQGQQLCRSPFWPISGTFVDPCTDHTLVKPTPGPGIDELADALANQPGTEAESARRPSRSTGIAAKRVDVDRDRRHRSRVRSGTARMASGCGRRRTAIAGTSRARTS